LKVVRRGFSLLEVLMAVALFGAVVTIILAAEAGFVASNKSAAQMSQAIEIGRCRMSEIEEKELKLGFPEMEEKDSSQVCCDDKEVAGFTCEWLVDRVTLPQANPAGIDGGGLSSILGGGLGLDSGAAAVASGMATTLAGPSGAMLVNPAGGASLDLDGGLQNIGQSIQQSMGGMGGAQGLLSMAFSIVYPSLKPLLESAIRRVTVIVKWKEGLLDRDFTLVQYITNPSRAGLLAGMADAGLSADGGIPGLGGLGALLGGASSAPAGAK
jgi:general secretion pathway protein I